MASSLMISKSNILVYRTTSLKSLFSCLRLFSSQNKGHRPSENLEELLKPSDVSTEPWLNIKAGIFGPDDYRLPLPGNIGVGHKTLTEDIEALTIKISELPKSIVTRHIDLLENRNFENVNESVKEEMRRIIKETTDLECVIQECPKLLKKDLSSLFPQTNFAKQNVTVVTMCQKTTNDMSGWSEKVEAEREELISHFVQCANKICEILIAEGYWADFIDPTSGRPYLGPFTNSTLFETDERYRHFGFVIDDLGCCKVITHSEWGPNIFVGAIFTNATVDSDVLVDSLVNHTAKAKCC